MYPTFSRDCDDRLSVVLMRGASSPLWNVFALGALVCLVVLLGPQETRTRVDESLVEKILIGWAVVGVVGNALSAMVHSASRGRYARGVLLFAVWPLSFPYNWREMIRRIRERRDADAV